MTILSGLGNPDAEWRHLVLHPTSMNSKMRKCPGNGKLVAESGIEDWHPLIFHPLVTDGASRSDQSKMKSDGGVFFNCGVVS